MKNLTLALVLLSLYCHGQENYWQQAVDYKMDIDFEVQNHTFTGNQELTYTNNSPDTLFNVYYHLYFNAFQPNSMMDVRSRNLPDPDRRVMDRISKLTDEEIGYLKVGSLTQDGQKLGYKVEATILEVKLEKPILPGSSTVFKMEFTGQVPVQIRRSGRDNREGISYSMAQWFPKMAEYDQSGWHAHPYIAREFYAPWGDYEVNISIDRNYVVAASGILQNPEEIGYGYESEGMKVKRSRGSKLTWRFKAERVHDFMWAADPDYVHTKAQVPDGPELHFFYQEDSLTTENWGLLPDMTIKAFEYMNEEFGEYPYPVFVVIQGGDGGMEYPMSTLITGQRSLPSLVGVTVHEAMHSWYQGVLATNESYLSWMDEGFTSYATNKTMARLFGRTEEIHKNSYAGYYALALSGNEEPMTTHSDHYSTNFAYGRAAYSKGAVSLAQLGYIIGESTLKEGLLRYFDEWKFKHPSLNDFIRVMEKTSGLELDWYYDYWVGTTKQIDYAIDTVQSIEGKTLINLSRKGEMPMPIEISVTKTDGSKILYYIPLGIMRGEKKHEGSVERKVMSDWYWTHPIYEAQIDIPLADIQSIVIDQEKGMADLDRENNSFSR
jgi:hypothetical protein